MVNWEWLKSYPQSYAKFKAGGVSDHARCLVKISGHLDESWKPFRFFNYLTEHEDFLPTIKDSWDASPRLFHSRYALTALHKKLKQLKFYLRVLNKANYGDLHNRTKHAYEELCDCHNKALLDPNPETFAREAEASARWQKLARIE